ncbi:MAG: 3-phosphoshikimate 1-carboxyvinyltransferase [Planctomycetota bacterium]
MSNESAQNPSYCCPDFAGPLRATVRIPGSKSVTNRALICAALADGTSLLKNALLAEDTRLMIEVLRNLGIAVTVDELTSVVEITGCRGDIPASEAELFCGNAGTVMRFGSALVATGYGTYRLDGAPRMRERPIGPLGAALQELGAGIEYLDQEGYPPLHVHANGLRGGSVSFSQLQSSQFVSALMLAAPYARGDVFIETIGDVPSRPYLAMTQAVMERFGVNMLRDEQDGFPTKTVRLIVESTQRYQGTTVAVEPDATNATYFLAAPAVAGGTVTVEGFGTESVQGDVKFVDLLEKMGCAVEREASRITVSRSPNAGRLRAIDADLNAMPDTVPTLAVLALFADGQTTIRNVANLRVKETDRLEALANELTKFGATADSTLDGLTIHPPDRILPATIETYDDHRMAMSFALAGLKCPGVVIRNPGCCAKSFPDFFARWERMIHAANET